MFADHTNTSHGKITLPATVSGETIDITKPDLAMSLTPRDNTRQQTGEERLTQLEKQVQKVINHAYNRFKAIKLEIINA